MEDTRASKLQQYYSMLYRYVRIRLGNDAEAADIVQETLCRYLQTDARFENEGKERAWLFAVASNLCKNYWRSSWRRYTVSIADNDIPCSPSPEMLALNSEENESLMKSVLSLPLKYKEVIYLYYYEDLSVDEISQITGRKPSTIQTQLERGRKMMKKKLDAKIHVLAIIAAIALISSIGVYAHSQYQRTVRHINNGISVSDLNSQSSSAEDGLVTIHDYTPTEETTGSESTALDNEPASFNGVDSEWSDYYVMDDGTVETIAQGQLECLEFSSWVDAMGEISFTVAYPDIDCPVQIYIWQADYVEAVYMNDNTSFSIDYSYFENSNWEYESIYNGEIIEQLEYINSYGDVFTGSNVATDQESHIYFSVAFDHYLIKLEFENMETEEIYEVLEAFNLETYRDE